MSRARRSARRRLGAEEELRQLPHPVRGEPAADPLRRHVGHLRRPLAHLAERVLVRLEAELRDEAQAADDPQRVVAEARRARRAEDAPLEVAAAVERVEHLAGLDAAGDRVDGEVAPAHVLGERDRRVGHDLEVVAPRPGRLLHARRRELDPRRRQHADGAVAWKEPDADVAAVHGQVLDPAVRLEGGAELLVADARDDEVRVLVRDPEQVVAHGAADLPRVEVEAAHVVLGRSRRHPDLHAPIVTIGGAIASISTRAPDGSAATSTVERAGGRSPTWRA